MAGAMGKIGTGLPERDAGERIEIAAACALGEAGEADADHALQHQREEALLLLRHGAYGDRAGDIGRAVDILRAGIDEEHRAGLDGGVCVGGHAIMHDGGVGTSTGDAVEGHVLQRVLLAFADAAAHLFQLLRDGDFRLRAWRGAVEPGEELHHGGAILQMGAGGALQLDAVLAGAGQAGRIDGLHQRAALAAHDLAERERCLVGINQDALAFGGEGGDSVVEIRRRQEVGELGEIGLGLDAGLALVEEEQGAAVCRDDGAGERMRRMRYVAAADVEDPGDGGGIGDGECIRTGLHCGLRHLHQLVPGELAGMLDGLDGDAAERFGRAVRPGLVERVVGQEDEAAAKRSERLFQAAHFGCGVQPWVDAEAETLGAIVLQPEMRRLADEIAAGIDAAIHLFGELRDIAAVDEDDGLFTHDERHARRTGKARQPGQTFRRSRHIFALIFIGAWHQETVDTKCIEGGAQCVGPFAAILGRGGDVETLEHGMLPLRR